MKIFLFFLFVGSAISAPHVQRSLLDAVTSLTDGTKLGTALKVVSAFDKVGKFINDLKSIAPEAHSALQGSITDIQNSMTDIVNNLAGNLENGATATAPKQSRSLLDAVTSLTDGTKLGTALKVVSAFDKVGKFISDLKSIAPEAHSALQGSITDIQNSMTDIVNNLAGNLENGSTTTAPKQSRSLLDAVTSLTDGTKLGTALKVVSAFDKVGKFINDLKSIAPEAHSALQGSITDIQNSMTDIVNNLAGNIENGATTTAPKQSRSLLDAVTSLTSGTKLGTALKVVSAFDKVGKFISDLKTIAPEAHAALQGSITDIQNSMTDIVNNLAGNLENGATTTAPKQSRSLLDAVTSLTDGTKLGTALKVVSAFDKVGKFISDLKTIAPEAHSALQGSITDIQNSMTDIVNNLAGNLENGATTTSKPH